MSDSGIPPEELVAFGSRFEMTTGSVHPVVQVQLRELRGPKLTLSSGALGVADPWEPLAVDSWAETVCRLGPGEHQIAATIADHLSGPRGTHELAVAMTIGEVGAVAYWRRLPPPGASSGSGSADGSTPAGFEVEGDSGLCAFFDTAERALFEPLFFDSEQMLGVSQRALSEGVVALEVEGRVAAVAVSCVNPEGPYLGWAGYDAGDGLVAVLMDLAGFEGPIRRVSPGEPLPAPVVVEVAESASELVPADLVAFGAEFVWPGGEVSRLTALVGPALVMPSRELAVADPGRPDLAPKQRAALLSRLAKHPVIVSMIEAPVGEGDAMVSVPCAVSISDVERSKIWDPEWADGAPLLFESVSGLGVFYDITEAELVVPLFGQEETIAVWRERVRVEHIAEVEVDGRVVAAVFDCSRGSGRFPVYGGCTSDGPYISAMVDLGVLAGAGRLPTTGLG